MKRYDVLVLGAGASGLVCAWRAAAGGARVGVVDHGRTPARKVRISGGGRCNLTNRDVSAANYACGNPHFVKSALARFGPEAVLDLARGLGMDFEERDHGRIFCRQAADGFADGLARLAGQAGAELMFQRLVLDVTLEPGGGFRVTTSGGELATAAVVLALGGPAWPQAGATSKGIEAARSLGLKIVEPRPALAPLVMPPVWPLAGLAGVSVPVRVTVGRHVYDDDLLFTHDGLSGPAALQISLRWQGDKPPVVDFLPQARVDDLLSAASPKAKLKNILAGQLPARLAAALLGPEGETPAGQVGAKRLSALQNRIHAVEMHPQGLGGWKRAEVTAGGVDTDEVSSKTMEAKGVPGLFVLGETLDVTGELGGYNLQWAFASGHAAGSVWG